MQKLRWHSNDVRSQRALDISYHLRLSVELCRNGWLNWEAVSNGVNFSCDYVMLERVWSLKITVHFLHSLNQNHNFVALRPFCHLWLVLSTLQQSKCVDDTKCWTCAAMFLLLPVILVSCYVVVQKSSGWMPFLMPPVTCIGLFHWLSWKKPVSHKSSWLLL